jgi:hypothetical protein
MRTIHYSDGRSRAYKTTAYPWLVVRTAFHDGGIVSRHRTRAAADAASRRIGSRSCTCGCTCVIAAADYDALPVHYDAGSPYAAARR